MNLKPRLGQLTKKGRKLFLVLGLIALTITLAMAIFLTNSTARNLIINSEAAGSGTDCVYEMCGNFNERKAECDKVIKENDDLGDELVKLRQIKSPNNRQKARIRVLDNELSAQASAQVYVNCRNYYNNKLIDCINFCKETGGDADNDKPKITGGRTGGSRNGDGIFRRTLLYWL